MVIQTPLSANPQEQKIELENPGQVEKKPLEQSGDQSLNLPTPPLMQIITKGWLFKPDEYATAAELERARNDKR